MDGARDSKVTKEVVIIWSKADRSENFHAKIPFLHYETVKQREDSKDDRRV